MGSTSQTGREREREMFLIVILLISPAFGFWPNSAQLQRSSAISDDLEAAELDILELEAGLSNLQVLNPELRSEESYVARFEGAKSYLQQARQELNDLADTTVRESRDVILHLEDYDRNNDPDLLEITIDIMKDLMLETKERLEEARKKYQSAIQAFHNIISSVETDNQVLDKIVRYRERYDEMSENFRATQADFKSKSHSFFRRVEIIIEDIIDNIELIYEWAIRTETVRKNIERFPSGYIYRFTKTGLLHMKNSAEQFLA